MSKFPELYKAAPACRRDALRLSAGCVYVSSFGIIADVRFFCGWSHGPPCSSTVQGQNVKGQGHKVT